MVQYDLLENYPAQVLTYQDLEAILGQVEAELPPPEWPTESKRTAEQATREWEKLAAAVREALETVFVYGPAAKKRCQEKVEAQLERCAWIPEKLLAADSGAPASPALPPKARPKRARLTDEVRNRLRRAYFDLLDHIYGSILRHVLRHIPTAVVAGSGYFHLTRLDMFRYARVRETEDKSALGHLLDIMHEGVKVELEYSWKPVGEGLAEAEAARPAWRRR